MSRNDFWKQFDFWLFGSVVILCIFGIAMIQSAIAGNEELLGYENRQAIFVAGGMVVLLVFAFIDYRYWQSLSRVLYIFAVVLLVGIYVIGTALYGSARWFDTGVILIQPSEMIKIIMIMVLANYFARNQSAPKDLRWIISSFLLTAGVVIWIILQPNLSTSIVIFVIWFALLWISGLPPKYFLILGVVAVIFFAIAFPLLEPYQQSRIVNFIFPDPNATYGDTYNVEQALISIGSGGWLGMGYGHGTQVQLRFMKVRHTDFIFSAIAEEFGFVGTMAVLGLLLFVIFRCFRAGKLADDMYGSLLAYGVGTLMAFQTAVNVGVNLNVLPVTGLTLPFVSYGGSSLIALVMGVGLVESVIAHRKAI
ncbi:MAG: FtsW/RodA/SpoVE family cell cycle protein [Anaerolineaceae bacterium]